MNNQAASSLGEFSAKVNNFKCFGANHQGFDTIKPINLVIGRNNSGKSALLDLIGALVAPKFEISEGRWHDRNEPELLLSAIITEEAARGVFPEGTSGGVVPGRNHWEFGRQLVGARLEWKVRLGGEIEFVTLNSPDGTRPFDKMKHDSSRIDYGRQLAQRTNSPLGGRIFRKLGADRDIRPENDGGVGLESNGVGATNIIQNYLNKAVLDRDLVEVRLLSGLNKIFKPDSSFKRILCQQLMNQKWEIYLEEEHKGRIALSESGSGLKTIILVLVNLFLMPAADSKQLSGYVFGFEELENNLHPSLLRRLLTFIAERAREDGFVVVLTTHSSAAIDLFSKNVDAQIIHVRHDGKAATATTVRTYIDNCGILDDLDVRASDLLQANSVIWVEGPSDRIYINRWIAIWSNGTLQEGVHYQCVFYGGRLLAHLEGCAPDDANSGVAILRLARHACIVIDSDKQAEADTINATKQRIAREVETNGGLTWITDGRQIENYLPPTAFQKWRGWTRVEAWQRYDDLFDLLDGHEDGLGKRYREKKPLLAETVSPHLELEDCRGVPHLEKRLTTLCQKIREWNSVKEDA